MRKILTLCLLAGVCAAGDEATEARLDRIEKRLADLDRRLTKIEKLLGGLQQRGEHQARVTKDMNSVRNIVGLLTVAVGAIGKVPMDNEARVDVYYLVRRGEIGPQNFRYLRSARFEYPLTDEEIQKGDYTNFPYERFLGVVEPGRLVPLIWDKKPDADNKRVMGFTGGAVKYFDEAKVQAILERCGQLPQNPPRGPDGSARADMNTMRNIVGLITLAKTIPKDKEDRIDIYAFVRSGEIAGPNIRSLRVNRFNYPLTDEEIQKGDYTNFAYGRFKGDIPRNAQAPLLWDKEPDLAGKRIVGFSGGAVKYMEDAKVLELLKKYKQLPEKPPK